MSETLGEQFHEGPSHLSCPACKPKIEQAERWRNLKFRKVYGKITAKSRAQHTQNQLYAKRLYTEAFQEHRKATSGSQ